MKFSFLRKERAVGLDVGNGAVKALALERRRSEVVVVRRGVAPVETGDAADLSRAIHAALADAGADGEPVIAAVGGPDVVIRQLSLPPVPKARILPALELQHRELGLLPPREAVMDDLAPIREGHPRVRSDLGRQVPREPDHVDREQDHEEGLSL